MSYYNRPLLVKKALESVIESHQHHPHWSLTFCDDNSPVPGGPIVLETLKEFHDRLTLIRTNDTIEQKIAQGLTIGRVANEALSATDADLAIVLCDDDRLVPTYLRDLSRFYEENPSVMYAWSKLHIMNLELTPLDHELVPYNSWEGAIEPRNKVDGSQVSFRTSCFKDHGVRYLDVCHRNSNLDAELFSMLYEKFGPAPCTNLVGQYKAIHDYQLIRHKFALPNYYNDVEHEGGKKF